MDVRSSERAVLTSGTSSLLRALAGARSGLTGRVVADLSDLSPNGASEVLHRLEEVGLLRTEPVGRAILWAARGTSHAGGDRDLLVIRPGSVSFDDSRWRTQLGDLSRAAHGWTGHLVSWLELSASELTAAMVIEEHIVGEWQRDGARLAGPEIATSAKGAEVR